MNKSIIVLALLALTTQAVHIDQFASPVAALPDSPPVPYKASDSGAAKDGYVRVIPAQFTDDVTDQLMATILKDYAIETRKLDGKPSGNFYLLELDAKALATKICKGKGKTDEWIATMFPSAW